MNDLFQGQIYGREAMQVPLQLEVGGVGSHSPLSFSIILSLSHFIGLYDWRRSLEWKFEDSEKQISKFYFKKKKQILNILTSLTSQEMASKSTSLEKVNFE